MQKILIALFGLSSLVCAQDYMPNAATFTCPADTKVNLSIPMQISVAQTPAMIGECWWGKPIVSYSISNNGNTVNAEVSWELDGPVMANGCYKAKGQRQTVSGLIAKVSCKTQ